MRVFIQDDEMSDCQFVEFGKETRKIIINIVSTLFGDKYMQNGTVSSDALAFEVTGVGRDRGRNMLVLKNIALESLIHSLEILDIEVVFVKCSGGMASEFDETLNLRYNYIWGLE
jgi:hypothetical protein